MPSPRRPDHRQVVGPVPDRHDLRRRKSLFGAYRRQALGLGRLAQDRRDHPPRQSCPVILQPVRPMLVEPRRRRDPLGEKGEPARDQSRIGPRRRHPLHQVPRTRVQPHAAVIAVLQHAQRQARQLAHPRMDRLLEIQFAPHRRLGHRRHLRLGAGKIRQFVDALHPDHGAVHVGDEKPGPRPRRHDVEIYPCPGPQRVQIRQMRTQREFRGLLPQPPRLYAEPLFQTGDQRRRQPGLGGDDKTIPAHLCSTNSPRAERESGPQGRPLQPFAALRCASRR